MATEVYHHEENRTPLHWACNGGCIQVLKYLVEQCKVDVDVRDTWDLTPLHMAVGSIQVVKYLVEELKCDVDVTDEDGETPLDYAVDEGRTEVVDYLQSIRKPSTPEAGQMVVIHTCTQSEEILQMVPNNFPNLIRTGCHGSVKTIQHFKNDHLFVLTFSQ